jgi:hypothetical protein
MEPGVAEDRRAPRRQVLQAVVCIAALFGVAARLAVAQIKVSQAAAGYQDHPNGKKQCGDCVHFTAPDKCALIAGTISAQGWCRLFGPIPGRAAVTGRGPPA